MLLPRSSIPARAAAFATAAVIFTGPAFAQQAQVTPVAASRDEVTVNTDCRTYKPGELMADTKCEILKGRALDAQAKALDLQGRELRSQGSQIAIQNACIEALVKFKKSSPEEARELAKSFGTVTRENACEAAGRIPKPTASAAPRVGG